VSHFAAFILLPMSDDRPPAAEPTFDEPRLTEQLWSEPYRFEFFAALRVLARIAGERSSPADKRSSLRGDRSSASDDDRAVIDRLKLRSYQSLSFPASEIVDLRPDASGKYLAEMTVAFLVLTGPLGALPRPYSELVIQRISKKDFALRDFLDLFNQRLLQIFAQAGEKYRFYLTYENASAREKLRAAEGQQKLRGFLLDERPRIDLFSQLLLDLAGLGTPLLRYKDSVRDQPVPRMAVDDITHRYFSGLLSQSHRSAIGLAQMVSEYFGLPAQAISFVGQWVQLPLEYQTCMRRPSSGLPLGATKPATCADPRLGRNTVVGSRIWELQGRFRIRLGPLTFEQFQDFLPVGQKFRPLAHLARLYAGPTFDFDVQPVLEGREVPWCQLGATGPRAPRLGWNTWLRNREFTDPVFDAIFPVPDKVSMGA
jgi:type VI secretion system protein ImpH